MSKMTFTPGDWVVEADVDQYGHYVLDVAAWQQETWVNKGFRMSDKEGEKRQLIANEHDHGNAVVPPG